MKNKSTSPIFRIQKSINIILFILASIFTLNAQANYLSIGETGEVIQPNSYLIGASLQSISSGKSGFNAGGIVDAGWTEDSSSRFSFGFGVVDFHVGASYKLIPFPDYENQPAIGLKSSFWLARIDGTSTTTLQLSPLISKKVSSTSGQFTPYFAIPINYTSTKDSSQTGLQCVVGTSFEHSDLGQIVLTGEVALNLKDSESGLVVLATIPFDGTKGFKYKKGRK